MLGYVYNMNIILHLSARIQEHVFLLSRTGDSAVRQFIVHVHKGHLGAEVHSGGARKSSDITPRKTTMDFGRFYYLCFQSSC